MSLVQYSSSSEDEEEEQPVTIKSVVENKPQVDNEPGISIANFLPPPKNRQPPKREPRVLGKAIRKVAGFSEENPDNIILEKSSRHVTSFIPSSLRNKQKQQASPSTTAVETNELRESPKPQIEIFQQVKNTKPIATKPTKVEVRPVVEEITKNEQISDDAQESEPKKRFREQDMDDGYGNIKEFNVSDFYQNNMELKDQGLLEENKRLHTVTHSKNQLSALLKNAKQDEDILNERIERGKRLKKEKGNKYGW